MAAQVVCMITNQGADLWLIQGRQPARHLACFASGELDSAEFREAVKRMDGMKVHVLADLIEEDFRMETIAKLHGRDHRALVERHLRREFRETHYRMVCGRFPDPGDRNREHVLLSGIIVPEQIDRWVSVLADAGCMITGVHSITQVCQQVVRSLPAAWRKGSRLLVTRNRHGGLRVTLFERGRLRFSRLSIHDEGAMDSDEFLMQELLRSRRFYENLRLIPRGAELHCLVLASNAKGAEEEVLDEGLFLRRLPELRYGFLPVHRLVNGEEADALLVEMLARNPPARAYATREQKRLRRKLRVNRVAWFAAMFSLAASTAYGTLALVDSEYMQRTSRLLERTRQILLDQLDTIRVNGPDTAYPVPFMKSVVEAAQRLQSHDGGRMLLHIADLGRVLSRYPDFVLKSLAWRPVPDSVLESGGTGMLEQLVEAQPDEHMDGFPDAILLKGEIPVDLLRMPYIQEEIRRLVMDLEELEGVAEVRLIQDPFDPERNNGLRGVAGGKGAEASLAPLSLLLRMTDT